MSDVSLSEINGNGISRVVHVLVKSNKDKFNFFAHLHYNILNWPDFINETYC